jgi:hypothetical protein
VILADFEADLIWQFGRVFAVIRGA